MLDVSNLNIDLAGPDEIFVLHPRFGRRYAISQYGQLLSCKKKKLLKAQMTGENQDVPAYRLRDDDGKYRTIKAAQLVASVYVHNPYPEYEPVDVHHKNMDPTDNRHTNLSYEKKRDHNIIHRGRNVFRLDRDTTALIEYPSVTKLCDELSIDSGKVYRAIRTEKLLCRDGNIAIIAVDGINDGDGKQLFIGYHPQDKAALINENDAGLIKAIVSAGIAIFGLTKAITKYQTR